MSAAAICLPLRNVICEVHGMVGIVYRELEVAAEAHDDMPLDPPFDLH
jgi:hypothetical protein